MKKIVIITGNEMRHQYFRLRVASEPGISVLASYCESDDKSLTKRTDENLNSSELQRLHARARRQAEIDFFSDAINGICDKTNFKIIPKGSINDALVIEEIAHLNPDLLVCYGSSLIKSSLLEKYEGRFLNVHLGLSPYYRGSGANVWPLIRGEPHMVGATFMYIDSGIDTGKIIHQIQADFFVGDNPHSVGNRLIKKMTSKYCEIIKKFDLLSKSDQPTKGGLFFSRKDFDDHACDRLYEMCQSSLIYDYLTMGKIANSKSIVENSALSLG